MKEISPEFIEKIRNNQKLRQRVAFEDPLWFSLLYLRDHFKYPFAPFHMEMFHLIKQEDLNFIVVMAFRESGKSAILNMANVLWSILGRPGKKFVIIMSKTQEQAKNHFLNIKSEFESNPLLKDDFGPFVESEEDLKRLSLELVYHGSKIMSITREQSIRGLKYGPYRPELIICDDLEDISSKFDKTEREVLYKRFQSEIIPVGSEKTRIIVLGNLISEESFMMQLRNDIGSGRTPGIFRGYPLVDDRGKILWPSKFLNIESIIKLQAKLSAEAWGKEYLLTLGSAGTYYEPSEDPVHLDWNEMDNKVIGDYFHKKMKKLINSYSEALGIDKPQPNLIQQMTAYRISAPTSGYFIDPQPGHPLYEKYQEYGKEREKIGNEYNEAFRRGIRARWDEKAKNEGDDD